MWTVIGFCAAALTMFAFVPQIVKIIRTRSARDVSLATLIQMTAGATLWLLYGIHLADPIIIVANGITDIILVAAIALYFQYRF
jgi:MtN3 and saliva related transmembrane protein